MASRMLVVISVMLMFGLALSAVAVDPAKIPGKEADSVPEADYSTKNVSYCENLN